MKINPHEKTGELNKRIEAAKKAQDDANEELRRHHQATVDLQAPANALLQEHEKLRQQIGAAQSARAIYLAQAEEFRGHMDRCIESEHDLARIHFVFKRWEELIHSDRAAGEISRWLEAAKAKLQTAESQLSEVVRARNLSHMLPGHLSHLV